MKKSTVSIIFKSQKIGDVEYLTFNSNNKTLVDLINDSILNKIKEYSKNPSMGFNTNYYNDLYLDGTIEAKDGTRFKLYDPKLKYSVADDKSTSYVEIDIFNNDKEINFNIKVSGKQYKDYDIMEFMKFLKTGSGCISAKDISKLGSIVTLLFHLSQPTEIYNPWNPPYKQNGWDFGSNVKI